MFILKQSQQNNLEPILASPNGKISEWAPISFFLHLGDSDDQICFSIPELVDIYD